MNKLLLSVVASALLVIGITCAQPPEAPSGNDHSKPEKERKLSERDHAVDRTRREVKVLDGIYKGGIVLITEHYITGNEDLPAGTAFKMLFETARKNNWHEVRLVDATGDPYSEENVAKTDFEKRAIQRLRAGESFVDETIVEGKQRYFLAATPIPVVMEKCTMCHSNYDMDAKDAVIGALTYRVPIDE